MIRVSVYVVYVVVMSVLVLLLVAVASVPMYYTLLFAEGVPGWVAWLAGAAFLLAGVGGVVITNEAQHALERWAAGPVPQWSGRGDC